MSFAPGALVKARGREWVVLPDGGADPDLLLLRPLGGSEEDVAGIYLPLEPVDSASFPLPSTDGDMGNFGSCRLLRDALRLSFRSGAGPFRSLSRIAIEPRPYQLVPLLMALQLDPVRILVADDVGVGKTVEACLIARELIDRGEVRRTAVLCPPHLAEQWQRDLRNQFHIDATLVLAGTAARLERDCPPGQSLFDRHPHVVVSMDFIKSERRRDEFLRTCPELVIVDEAHTCTEGMGRGLSQLRHRLLRDLSRDRGRHVILVTATPHSGKEETFRSLLTLLDESFANLPSDLSGDANRKHREALARHLVQRRRADLRQYMDAETPFPERELAEEQYTLSAEYHAFLDKVLAYCRETVFDETLDARRQRVRWWSALALLRSLSSSPAAAAATLRNRAAGASADNVAEVDELGRRTVLDLDDESLEGADVVPGAGDEEGNQVADGRRLKALAKEADDLAGAQDAKLKKAATLIRKLVDDGFAPIVFCRFIPTVEYLAEHLKEVLPKDVVIAAVTGHLPPEERELRVEALGEAKRRVLVCTDCLSEGINLQHLFDAVFHYDLSWNPTRHEQREGRVDRFGQERPVVRALTYYGRDNPVDGVVLKVLLRKHQSIHRQLGITVPVPMDTNAVMEAVMESLILQSKSPRQQMALGFAEPEREQVELEWDAAVEREKKSRSLFAQRSIRIEEVRAEVEASRAALGDEATVREFTIDSLRRLGGAVAGEDPVSVDLADVDPALREMLGVSRVVGHFSANVRDPSARLTRTHPVISTLAEYVLESALDPRLEGPASRCGLFRTEAVTRRTTILLLRLRFQLIAQGRDGRELSLLAEDQALVGFAGSPQEPDWLTPEQCEAVLEGRPAANPPPEQAREQLGRLLGELGALDHRLMQVAAARGDELLAAHRRVRKASGAGVRGLRVEPQLPVDILGAFVYLPLPGSAR